MGFDPTERDSAAPAPAEGHQWRVRYRDGDFTHYTEWTSEFAAVANLFEQYRRGEYGHDIVIERRVVGKT
ncbi:hypothetical protein [Haloarcula sp. JP-L23]|uniref:hypothetical protein n=1 Tax=Haloarcula sp. JP-L23 TaxID=2716717 RepID=UPI00140F280D|nr:hypothetical protein G9465_25330 [Haloarcula sp. JP-L23]